MNDKLTLDRIYTDQGFSDTDQKVILLTEKIRVGVRCKTDMGIHVSVRPVLLRHNYDVGADSLQSELLQKGFLQAGLANSSNQNLGVTLFMNRKFCHWFKIGKAKNVFLAP